MLLKVANLFIYEPNTKKIYLDKLIFFKIIFSKYIFRQKTFYVEANGVQLFRNFARGPTNICNITVRFLDGNEVIAGASQSTTVFLLPSKERVYNVGPPVRTHRSTLTKPGRNMKIQN